ncbi:hypothetical protein CJJ18_11570 (plasmid) [Candidatus Williamhamiltonella defendens]|uniref:Plasmid stabilization protein n=1 Tax=Candidatus Williamhamiltonella defendens TaxID=138072 RepID=A0AAC9YGQ9_9ENTR|nr:plasmid partitioning/stability family protein [Candidatus Hamiltonella defensa]ASV34602.1 hypothetical protein CJJ18_11570 [Candidatus Hamiltonella defensa]AWK17564.1 hypothetical protein CCS40_11385 [Candidatus Hamiltonella defensa]
MERKRLSIALTPKNIVDKFAIETLDTKNNLSSKSLLVAGLALTSIDPRLPNMICAMITEKGIEASDISRLIKSFSHETTIDKQVQSELNIDKKPLSTKDITKNNSKSVFGDD